MKIFKASFHTFLVHQMNSNFAYVFFRPFPGDIFFSFQEFRKNDRLWHFESSLRYENFWSFVFYISSSPNEFKFCMRLLQTIPWGQFFPFFLNFDKMTDFRHFESSLRFEKSQPSGLRKFFKSFFLAIHDLTLVLKFEIYSLTSPPPGLRKFFKKIFFSHSWFDSGIWIWVLTSPPQDLENLSRKFCLAIHDLTLGFEFYLTHPPPRDLENFLNFFFYEFMIGLRD